MTALNYLYIFAFIFALTGILIVWTNCRNTYLREDKKTFSKKVWRQFFIGAGILVPIIFVLVKSIDLLETLQNYNEELHTALRVFAYESDLQFEAAQILRLCANDNLDNLLGGASLHRVINCLKSTDLNLSVESTEYSNKQLDIDIVKNQLIKELRSSDGIDITAKINHLGEKLDALLVLFLCIFGIWGLVAWIALQGILT